MKKICFLTNLVRIHAANAKPSPFTTAPSFICGSNIDRCLTCVNTLYWSNCPSVQEYGTITLATLFLYGSQFWAKTSAFIFWLHASVM